jgi:hypothetical protein
MRRRCVIAVVISLLVIGARSAHAAGWSTRDYIAAGVPDLTRPWSTKDLRNAVDAITRAAAGHAERLPRYHSPSSGAVFAKLMEPPKEEVAAEVDAQVAAHFERYRALVDAGSLYSAIARQSMPREWIELTGVVLHEAVALEQLSGPFIAALPPGDDRLAGRRAMVAKLHDGTGKMLMLHLVVAIGDNVAVAERIAALDNLTQSAPPMLAVIAPRAAAALRNDVTRLAAETSGELHDAAVRLQRAMARAP